MSLIQPFEEHKMFDKLSEYYHKIHEDTSFTKQEVVLDLKSLGEVEYVSPGINEEATSEETIVEIKKAMKYGYNTPIIVLRSKGKNILLDGHRRLKAALELGIPWKALIMIPSKEKDFGIEKLVKGKAKDVLGK